MRTIQKTFSLEPMTSRMPSVLPAYKDNVLYYFDDAHLKEREYKYPSNYGMIPLKISFSKEVIDGNIVYSLDCGENAITLSFERLSNWYYFFKEYYHLLNDYGHCNRTYTSATEYYYYESGTRYADQMIYGTDEQTYIDLDEEFIAKGGIVEIETNGGASDIGFYKWICDNIVPTYYISKEYSEYWKKNRLYYQDVIKWIAWFSSRLFYEEEGSSIYSAATEYERERWDCKNESVEDCCDCEEYFNRGGKREYERMKSWYDSLQNGIKEMNATIDENKECFTPSMDDKIQLYNSLDDLGQYSIFSKEYELGIDYRTANYGDIENTHGGTVTEVNGETMILKDGSKGFCFSPYYMEKLYDENSWENYTDKYMHNSLCPRCGYYGEIGDNCPNCRYDGHDGEYGDFIRNSKEFIADGYRFYAFDKYNKMYTSNDKNELKERLEHSAYTYSITSVDAILIDGVLYDIQQSEYGEYDWNNQYLSGKTFFVYREKDTSTPYTLINGKKIYAEWYPNPNPEFGDKPCYYFTFFKNKNLKGRGATCGIEDNSFNITDYKPFGRKESTKEEDVIKYITYMGQILQVTNDVVAIDGFEYYRVNGYTYDIDNQLMYCIGNNVIYGNIDAYRYRDTSNIEETIIDNWEIVPNSEIIGNNIYIGVDYEVEIYNAKELSGHTVSRLTDLEATDVLVDDIGNKIDGKYNPNKNTIYNHQPPQGTELDLLYEVGNTSNIRRINGLTIEDLNGTDDNTINYFIGNIITNMVFYYKDIDGNVIEETKKSWETSSLETIHKSQRVRCCIEKKCTEEECEGIEIPEGAVIFDGDDIYCDVTYYIGATLKRTKDTNFELVYDSTKTSDNYNYGVEYKETVKFVKENREYYLKKMIGKQIPTTFNSPSAHTVSYPVCVYKLTQEMADIEGDVYNTYFQSPLAAFKTEINLINSDLTTNYDEYTDMDTYNNIHVTPTFKQEYMLGISSLENIDSDIYIERGINAAFEKHLKLGEVTSMEALEQYSNGYFKIINN